MILIALKLKFNSKLSFCHRWVTTSPLQWRHSGCELRHRPYRITSVKFYEKFLYLLDSWMFAILPAPNKLIIMQANEILLWTRLPNNYRSHMALQWRQWLCHHSYCIASVKFYGKFVYLLDSWMFTILPAPN